MFLSLVFVLRYKSFCIQYVKLQLFQEHLMSLKLQSCKFMQPNPQGGYYTLLSAGIWHSKQYIRYCQAMADLQ